ncbi:MAG TPA: hypothetical protein VJC12_01995 [Candidatus Paceibacterota bacterium]
MSESFDTAEESKQYSLENSSPAEIVLDESNFGNVWHSGIQGEIREGFSFYAPRKDEVGKVFYDYITSDMVSEPTLKAVTEDQYKKFYKQKIRAVPVKFVWDNEKRHWRIENT